MMVAPYVLKFIIFDDDDDVDRVVAEWDRHWPDIRPDRVWTGADFARSLAACKPGEIVIVMTHGSKLKLFGMGTDSSTETLAYEDVPTMTCQTLYAFSCFQTRGLTPWSRNGYQLLATPGIAYPDDLIALLGAIAIASDPSDARAVLDSVTLSTKKWAARPPVEGTLAG